MTREEVRQIVIAAYEHFFSAVTGQHDFEYSLNKPDERALDNFLTYLESKFGKDWPISLILTLIEHSFDYWVRHRGESTRKLRYGLNSIQLSWIVGKPAIERFESMPSAARHFPKALRYIHKKTGLNIYGEFGIDVAQTKPMTAYLVVREHEEYWKRMNHNTKYGLSTCLENTTLYNHLSEYCQNCDIRAKCKELLKSNYYKIFKVRGYE